MESAHSITQSEEGAETQRWCVVFQPPPADIFPECPFVHMLHPCFLDWLASCQNIRHRKQPDSLANQELQLPLIAGCRDLWRPGFGKAISFASPSRKPATCGLSTLTPNHQTREGGVV
eukprot:1152698-Pelagomonas_calceolata.AAC.7